MPDHRIGEESEIRSNSVNIVAGSDGLSFASCPTCPGPNRTPILHAECYECTPGDSSQPGKGIDGEVEAGVIINTKLNAASSSSSKAAEEQDKSSASCSKKQDKKPLPYLVPLLSPEESEKERPIVIREDVDVPAEAGNARLIVGAASSSSDLCKGKRKAEDDKDEPVSPRAKTNQQPAIGCKADKMSKVKTPEDHWKDHVPKLFGDLPDQPGTSSGCCAQTLYLSSLDDATHDPMDIQQVDIEPERAPTIVPEIVTFHVASFGLDFANQTGRLISFRDEVHFSVPEGVGLEDRLDILLRANGEEPSPMDDQEHF